jgi:hypothetical protein
MSDSVNGPHSARETKLAAVQVIAVLIAGELIRLAVEREAAVRDAVREAADDRAHLYVLAHIFVWRIEAEHDIAAIHAQPLDRRAEREDCDIEHAAAQTDHSFTGSAVKPRKRARRLRTGAPSAV